MVGDDEGDMHFLDSSPVSDSNTPDVEGLEENSCICTLYYPEDDIALCGRAETELEALFKFFARRSIKLSEIAKTVLIVARHVLKQLGLAVFEILRGQRPWKGPCRFGRTVAEKVNDTVSGTGGTCVWGAHEFLIVMGAEDFGVGLVGDLVGFEVSK